MDEKLKQLLQLVTNVGAAGIEYGASDTQDARDKLEKLYEAEATLEAELIKLLGKHHG